MASGKKFYKRPIFITLIIALLIAAVAVPKILALTERQAKKLDVQVETEEVWGQAVEGLAVRLRAKGATTAKRVTLLVDARNDGPGTYRGTRSTHGCWLKVDGKWYGRVQTRETVAPMLLKAGDRQLAFTQVRLSSEKSPLWRGGFIMRNGQVPSLGAREIHQSEPLELSPGRHTVRLAFPASRKAYAYSNAVEIGILPAEEKPAVQVEGEVGDAGVIGEMKFDYSKFSQMNEKEKVGFVLSVLQMRDAKLQNFAYEMTHRLERFTPKDGKKEFYYEASIGVKRKGNKLFLAAEKLDSKKRLQKYRANWDGTTAKSLLYRPYRKVTHSGLIRDREDNNFTYRAFNHILGLRLLDTPKLTLNEWFNESMTKGRSIDIDIVEENGKSLIMFKVTVGYKYWQWFLDVDRDYMPIRAEILYKVDENYNSDSSVVEEAIQVDGFWVPKKVFRRTGTSAGDGQGENTYDISTFTRNTVTDEDFEISFPPRTEVVDTVKNVSYRVLPNGGVEMLPLANTVEDKNRRDELVGKDAPAFPKNSTWLNSKPLTWQELRGKVVILDFWSEWCGPCRGDLPTMSYMHKKRDESGIVVIGVHTPGSKIEDIEKVMKKHELDYPICIDIDRQTSGNAFGEMSNVCGERGIPYAIVVDQQGKVAACGESGIGVGAVIGKANELVRKDTENKTAVQAEAEEIEKKNSLVWGKEANGLREAVESTAGR